MTTVAHSFARLEDAGMAVDRVVLECWDFSALRAGDEWQWLNECEDQVVSGGVACTAVSAHERAEVAVLNLAAGYFMERCWTEF